MSYIPSESQNFALFLRHMKKNIISRGFTPFFTAVYIVERLVLQTIYVLNKDILQERLILETIYVVNKEILQKNPEFII